MAVVAVTVLRNIGSSATAEEAASLVDDAMAECS
jgi:hypothetical protein